MADGRWPMADGVAAEPGRWRGRELPDGTRPMAWPIVLAAEPGRELPDGTRPMAWPLSVAAERGRWHQAVCWPLSVADRAGRSCWPIILADGR
jgi:hypothetical protein